MKYAYEDLGHNQFEKLVVGLCVELFGIGVQEFSEGPDGGRDAKFVGTAEIFPSSNAPWVGTTIIQAKHTNGYNKYFSESDFYSPTNSSAVLTKEIRRIKNLRDNKQLDHYFFVANRKLAANAESEIRSYISTECGIPESSIFLCGVEQLEGWLKKFKDLPSEVNLHPLDSPLIVSPDDLAEVVDSLSKSFPEVVNNIQHPPGERVTYDKKNELNNMSPEYARELRRLYLKNTEQVRLFLSAPENYELMLKYEDTIDEFNLKIIAKREDYQRFDDVINYLMDLLVSRDAILRNNKRLTRLMLFYMYWNCDIGEVSSD